ncbi:hypothetical protein AB0F03_33520 [Streptomyces sp. NPDC028722]|uniref:hypothetical protein n=1 Tax=Streptomyces sp. NPDC028722 TaxID=3155016 RepID=UPI0033DBFBFD
MCDAMDWFALDKLPEPVVAYCRAGLDGYRAGARMAVHFQKPGDPIAYIPDAYRLVLVPEPGSPGTVPEEEVRAFAERAVGRITTWTDVSWAREESRVWRAYGAEGGEWYVKIHQNDRFHQRSRRAPRLGAFSRFGRAPPGGCRRTAAGGRAHRGGRRRNQPKPRPGPWSSSARWPPPSAGR